MWAQVICVHDGINTHTNRYTTYLRQTGTKPSIHSLRNNTLMANTNTTATLEFLGTGTSTGVPIPGCSCPVCRSCDPHDNRLRSSVLIRNGRHTLVIDTGPEFRIQCLRAGLTHLDAVLITHNHADHIFGLDDVRPYSVFKRQTLPVWGSRHTLDSIRLRFDYIWNAMQVGGGLPDISLNEAGGIFEAAGMRITPLPIKHGKMDILGFRIGSLAYMSDVSAVPDETLPLLEGLDTMIISCVRHRKHQTHLNIAGAKALHRLIAPRQTFLTHLTHYFFHKDLIGLMPVDITPAYDGMRLEFSLET